MDDDAAASNALIAEEKELEPEPEADAELEEEAAAVAAGSRGASGDALTQLRNHAEVTRPPAHLLAAF